MLTIAQKAALVPRTKDAEFSVDGILIASCGSVKTFYSCKTPLVAPPALVVSDESFVSQSILPAKCFSN